MNRWSVSDLIDLEFFTLRDEAQSQQLLEQRDREIYLHAIKPQVDDGEDSKSFRRRALSIWLAEMRMRYKQDNGTQVLPGDAFIEACRLLGLVVIIIGILSGVGLALSMLVYDGTQPVNVSLYFGVLVVVQVLFLVLTLRFVFIKTLPGNLGKYSVLYPLLGGLLNSMMDKIVRSTAEHLPGRQVRNMEAMYGIARAKHTLYSRVIFWTIFALVQAFGIAFNLGVLSATFIRVFTADLAFGWQSTIQLSSDAVYALVRVVAAPWAWIIPPGIAYPSLGQIEGSRMVLKDGIYQLATADLVSWWPFLVCAVGVYALLPRVVLYAISVLGQKNSITKLDFSAAAFDRVVMRMMRPAVSTCGAKTGDQPGLMDEPRSVHTVYEFADAQMKACMVLVPADIIVSVDRERLREVVAASLGWKVVAVFSIQGETASDSPVIDSVADVFGKDAQGVAVVFESWQPPIIETTEFVKSLRKRLGAGAPIAVLLIGKPSGRNIFTPVMKSDKDVWERALNKLADPYLRVEFLEDNG